MVFFNNHEFFLAQRIKWKALRKIRKTKEIFKE